MIHADAVQLNVCDIYQPIEATSTMYALCMTMGELLLTGRLDTYVNEAISQHSQKAVNITQCCRTFTIRVQRLGGNLKDV